MEIPRGLLYGNLELLESAGGYPRKFKVSLRDNLYDSKTDITDIEVYGPTYDRISFAEAITKPRKPTKIGESFGKLWATYWFRLQFEQPEGETHLIWDSDSEATIYSEDGEALQGFNGCGGCDRRAEFILPGFAGPKVFWVEMACNGSFGGGTGLIAVPDTEKTFTLKEWALGAFNRKNWDLLADLVVFFHMCKEFKDTPRGEEAVYVGNQIYDIMRTTGDIDAARDIARQFFDQPNAPSQFKIQAIGHCHIDTAWLWPYAESRRKCVRSWSSQISYMNYYPWYKFCASAALHYKWVKQQSPDLFEKIQNRAREGRWLAVGGTWIEFDGNIPCGESMARQFLYGQKYFKKHFGKNCDVFFMPDTFGYSAQLPQIMNQSGIKRFVTQKLSWNLINKFPHTSFHWKGLDGSSVVAHFPPADTYNSQAKLEDIVKTVDKNKQKGRCRQALLLYGHGDGGGGPTLEQLESIQRYQDLYPVPKVASDGVSELFEALEASTLPEWQGELYLELHRGTLTTMSSVKKGNRLLELRLRKFEILAVLENATHLAKPIRDCWRSTLLHQFHDVLPGTSIEIVYDDVAKDFELQNDILSKHEEEMSSSVNAFNSLTSEYKGAAEINGEWKCIMAEPMSFAILDPTPYAPCSIELTEGIATLSNGYTTAKISSNGQLISLKSVDCPLDFINPEQPGNQFAIYNDMPFFWDAWDVEIYHFSTRMLLNESPGTLEILTQSDQKVSLKWTQTLNENCKITQTISLIASSPVLEFDTTIEWSETYKILKVEFGTNMSCNAVASYDIQYGHLTRGTNWNTSWDVAKFETCGHKWMDLSDYNAGISILNDCKYGMHSHTGLMTLSLLRSSKMPNENADMGTHTFRYGVYPHMGNLQSAHVPPVAESFNNPITAVVESPKTSLIRVDYSFGSESSVVIDAVKFAEDNNGIIIRMHENYGGSVRIYLDLSEQFGEVKSACRSNIIEDDEEAIATEGNRIGPLDLAAFQLLTLRALK